MAIKNNVLRSHGVFAASRSSGNYPVNVITFLRNKHNCIHIIGYWEHDWAY